MEKKIKSAEDFLFEYGETVSDGWQSTYTFNSVVIAMKKYTEYIVEAQLKIAAEEAEFCVTSENENYVSDSCYIDEYSHVIIDSDSIRNCTRINLE